MTLSVALSHQFSGFSLDVAFDAPAGVTALFGKSGAGKSSVINAVAGLLCPDRGRIILDGTPVFDSETGLTLPPHRRRIGYVFQDGRLFPHLTVRQNLTYGRWFAGGRPDRSLFDQIVALLGLDALLSRRPGALSGGEKQRVAIGRAILSKPRLLLMDEPLAALDEARKAEILPYLETLRDDLALPILYVSHSISEVARLADTLVMIDAGKVTACGPVSSVLADPGPAVALESAEAGAILTLHVAGIEADGLTRLDSATGSLLVPDLVATVGAQVRVRILARDVMLATRRPEGISALNILPAHVGEICPDGHSGALVSLLAGEDRLLARVTARSVAQLGLVPGMPVFAVLKAVSVSRQNVGIAGWARPSAAL